MPGQLSIAFRGFDAGLLAANIGSAERLRFPPRRAPGFGEETVLRAGLEALAVASPARAPSIRTLFRLMAPPPATLRLLGSVPGAIIRIPSPDFTLTYGLTSAAGAIVTYSAGAGVYFWFKMPGAELGVYGSLAVGLMSNIGASATLNYSFLFDKAPTVLAGDLITLSVEIDVPPVSVGGQLFIMAPPVSLWPPAITGAWTPQIVGIGFSIGIGISVFPVTVSVMPSRTWIRPALTI